MMVSQHKSNNLHVSITDFETNAVPINGLNENKGGSGSSYSSRYFENRANTLHEVEEVWGNDTNQNPRNNQETGNTASIAARMPTQTSGIDKLPPAAAVDQTEGFWIKEKFTDGQLSGTALVLAAFPPMWVAVT